MSHRGIWGEVVSVTDLGHPWRLRKEDHDLLIVELGRTWRV